MMHAIFFQKKGTHRAPLIDKDGKMISIVTQSDVIKFISKHVKDLGEFGKKNSSRIKFRNRGSLYN